jgi:hypothetical protein
MVMIAAFFYREFLGHHTSEAKGPPRRAGAFLLERCGKLTQRALCR